jgi:hypothetical protein
MREDVLRAYLDELATQCLIAKHAIADLNTVISDAYMDMETIRFWSDLQVFFAAAANMRKLLWPGHRGDSARGTDLRTELGVANDSPLHDNELRNRIEHMDERLDAWAQNARSTSDTLIRVRVIGPGSPRAMGIDPGRCLLYFDAQSWQVTFQGEKPYEILPLSWAIYALHTKVTDALAT